MQFTFVCHSHSPLFNPPLHPPKDSFLLTTNYIQSDNLNTISKHHLSLGGTHPYTIYLLASILKVQSISTHQRSRIEVRLGMASTLGFYYLMTEAFDHLRERWAKKQSLSNRNIYRGRWVSVWWSVRWWTCSRCVSRFLHLYISFMKICFRCDFEQLSRRVLMDERSLHECHERKDAISPDLSRWWYRTRLWDCQRYVIPCAVSG